MYMYLLFFLKHTFGVTLALLHHKAYITHDTHSMHSISPRTISTLLARKKSSAKKQIRLISNSYGNTILRTKLVSPDAITSDFAKHTIFHNIPFYQMSIYCLQVIKLQGFLLPSGSNCLLLININKKRWLYHQIGKESFFLMFTVSQRSSMRYLLQG